MNRMDAAWIGGMTLLLILALTGSAAAQAPDDQWHFTFAPYLVGPGMSGTTGVRGYEADVSVSASDIFSRLKMGCNGIFVAEKGDWGFGVDVIYMALGSSTDYVNVDLGQAGFTFLGSRRLAPNLKLTFGARWNIIRDKMEFKSNSPVFTGNVYEKTYQWVDPVAGIVWSQPLGRRWMFSLPANVGGFGAASKIALDMFPNLQYQVAKRVWLGAGWRLMYMDYRTGWDDPQPALNPDAFLYDITTTGPVVGMVFQF